MSENTGYRVGALPPYSVTYINSAVCGGERDRWHVMGTVGGDPRDPCGPVAICEWEPSAHTIAALLNATHGHSRLPVQAPWWRRLFGVIGRKERARPVGRVVVSFEADTTAFEAAMERAATVADVVVPQQRQGGTS